MSDLDFTRSAQSDVYDAGVARLFFQANGKPRNAAAGSVLFAENGAGNVMYFIDAGEVVLTRGGKPLDVIKPGEVLGEMSVLTGAPRSATATARSDCVVIELDGATFAGAIEKTPEFALMLLSILIKRLRLALAMQMLGRTPAQAADVPVSGEVFDKDLLRELTSNFPGRPPVYHPKNGVIMREGEGGIFMYVVIDGAVRITVRDKPVELVRPGGVFGEMALVDQSKRAASASAAADSNLLSINRNDFLKLIKTNPAFGNSLLRALANRLRNTGRK